MLGCFLVDMIMEEIIYELYKHESLQNKKGVQVQIHSKIKNDNAVPNNTNLITSRISTGFSACH